MSNSNFPTLLSKRVTLFGSLTRYDLASVGAGYLILSWLKVSGIYSLVVICLLLLLLKLAQKWLNPGFFRFIADDTQIKWVYKWEDNDE